MRTRSFLVVSAALLLLAACRGRVSRGTWMTQGVPLPEVALDHEAPAPVAPRAAAPALDAEGTSDLIAALVAGNARYRSGSALHPRQDAARRGEVATGQKPRVAVLACADSRTAPEVLFDQGLGDLFVVRVAGNVDTDEVTASLEYAVEHLGVKLVVVLGHERCGAVKAALAGGDLPGHLPALINRIKPAVDAVPADSKDRENDAIAANARLTAARLTTSGPVLEGAIAHHHVMVIAAVYDLDTGAVNFLTPPPPPPTGPAAPKAGHKAGH